MEDKLEPDLESISAGALAFESKSNDAGLILGFMTVASDASQTKLENSKQRYMTILDITETEYYVYLKKEGSKEVPEIELHVDEYGKLIDPLDLEPQSVYADCFTGMNTRESAKFKPLFSILAKIWDKGVPENETKVTQAMREYPKEVLEAIKN